MLNSSFSFSNFAFVNILMRFFRLLFLFPTLLLASCSVDEFSPCDDLPGSKGLLCKEFRFDKDVSIGYLAYYYNSQKQLSRTEYKTTDGKLKKFETFEYESGKLLKERAFNESGNLLHEKIYSYNTAQNLSNIYHIENGVEVFLKTFEYKDSLLQKEMNFSHNQLQNFTLYQYYNGENKLYRKSNYSAAGNLLDYTNIEYFVNNYERHNHYTGAHVFTGYDVYNFDENGNRLRLSHYNASGKLFSYINYSYSNGKLDLSEEYNEEGEKIKHTKFIYH